MLEHAEISIAEVDAISRSDALAVTDEETRARNHVLQWLRDSWDTDRLPQDRRRLVDTLLQLTRGLGIGVDDLIAAVDQDTARGDGIHLRNLSPYGIVVKALFSHRRDDMHRLLKDRNKRRKLRLFLTEEMEIGDLPDGALPARYCLIRATEAARNAAGPQPEGEPDFWT